MIYKNTLNFTIFLLKNIYTVSNFWRCIPNLIDIIQGDCHHTGKTPGWLSPYWKNAGVTVTILEKRRGDCHHIGKTPGW